MHFVYLGLVCDSNVLFFNLGFLWSFPLLFKRGFLSLNIDDQGSVRQLFTSAG